MNKLESALIISAFLLLQMSLPFLLIWSINTLFSLTICYNIKTWFAMFILLMIFNNDSSIGFKFKNNGGN